MEAARAAGASIYGVVGAPGGTLAELADVAILIEPPAELRTPLVESFQAVVWHALVSHPESRRSAGPLGVARAAIAQAVSGSAEALCDDRHPAAASGGRGVPRSRRGAQRGGPDPASGDSGVAAGGSRRAPDRGRRRGGAAARTCRLRACRASPISPPRRRASVSLGQLLAVHERVVELLARRARRLEASRLCLHHPEGVIPATLGTLRLSQAGAGDAAGRGRRALDSSCRTRGWSATPTPTLRRGEPPAAGRC